MLRMADLYLLYAEAVNESEGPNGAHSSDMFRYIDLVRSRAGLPGVKKAWDDYSDTPGKYNTQAGMKEIIHRERLIELSFEGQRFWDLRRWKEVAAEYEKVSCPAIAIQPKREKDMTGKKKTYYRYSICFKEKVVQEDSSGSGITEVCRRYGIKGTSTVQGWIRRFGREELLNTVVLY
jgi:hypothetical protein